LTETGSDGVVFFIFSNFASCERCIDSASTIGQILTRYGIMAMSEAYSSGKPYHLQPQVDLYEK